MGSYIGNCFDKQPVNTGRQRELDVAKGIIIIFMLLSHAIEIVGWYFEPHAADGFFWYGFSFVHYRAFYKSVAKIVKKTVIVATQGHCAINMVIKKDKEQQNVAVPYPGYNEMYSFDLLLSFPT